jgi:hypothetical protein
MPPDMSGLCIFLDLNIKAFLSAFHDPPHQTCQGREMAKRQDEQIAATGSLFSAQHIRENRKAALSQKEQRKVHWP